MQTLSWLIEAVQEEITRVILTVTLTSMGWGFLGLVLSIVLLVVATKRKWLNRPYWIWTFFAKLNFVYLPILFITFGSSLGLIHGIQRVADDFLERIAVPFEEYANIYIQDLHVRIPDIPWESYADLSLEEMIAIMVMEETDLPPDSYVADAIILMHVGIWEQVLDELEVPDALRHPMGVASILEASRGQTFSMELIPAILQNLSDNFFAAKYMIVLFFFLPFVLAPFAECLIYIFLIKSGPQNLLKRYANNAQKGNTATVIGL